MWVNKVPRGPRIIKFRHWWRGSAVMLQAAAFDNYEVQYVDSRENEIVHCSALVPYHADDAVLQAHAQDLESSWNEDEIGTTTEAEPDQGIVVALPIRSLTRPSTTLHEALAGEFFVEIARWKSRNLVGRYEVNYLVERRTAPGIGERHWFTSEQFEALWRAQAAHVATWRADDSIAIFPAVVVSWRAFGFSRNSRDLGQYLVQSK